MEDVPKPIWEHGPNVIDELERELDLDVVLMSQITNRNEEADVTTSNCERVTCYIIYDHPRI